MPTSSVGGSEICWVLLDRRDVRRVVGASAELALREGATMTVIVAYRPSFWWADDLAALFGLPVEDPTESLRQEVQDLARRLEGRLRIVWIPVWSRVEEVTHALLSEGRFGTMIVSGRRSRGVRRLTARLVGIARCYGLAPLSGSHLRMPVGRRVVPL